MVAAARGVGVAADEPRNQRDGRAERLARGLGVRSRARRRHVERGEHVERLAYDALGETDTTTFEPLDAAGAGLLADVYTTQTTYDRLGRLARITYPNGETVTYGYDPGGAVTSAASDVRSYVQNILYDELGHRTQITYGNGVVANYTYTPELHRLDTLTTRAPQPVGSPPGTQGPALQALQYTYALNGNVTDLADHPLSSADEALATHYQHYEYDALDQLRFATADYDTNPGVGASRLGLDGQILAPGIEQTYTATFTYDALGRMATNEHDDLWVGGGGSAETDHKLTYAYPATGSAQVHAPAQITEATLGTRTLTWDANGNQTAGSGGDGPERTTWWDDENRVLSVTDKGHTATTFRYDAGGERTHKVTDTAFTVYPNQWASVRGTGVDTASGGLIGPLETNHVYVGEERVASAVGDGDKGQAYWYLGNHLGSTGYVTDATGAVTEHVEYYPFGAPWVQEQGRVDSPGAYEDFLFTGKELDSETGLYYFGARYYDSDRALWASADPALGAYLAGGPNGGVWNPANLGTYSYTWNAPVWLRDPNGAWSDGPPADMRACTGDAACRSTATSVVAGGVVTLIVAEGLGATVLGEALVGRLLIGAGSAAAGGTVGRATAGEPVSAAANPRQVVRDALVGLAVAAGGEAVGAVVTAVRSMVGAGTESAAGAARPAIPPNPGRPFPENAQPGEVVQNVDPNSLSAGTRMLTRSQLEAQRRLVIGNTPRRDGPIEVEPNGVVWNDNHGTRAAAEEGRAVVVRVRAPQGPSPREGHGPITDLPVDNSR